MCGGGEKELYARPLLNFRRETVNIVPEPRVLIRPSVNTNRPTEAAHRRLTAGVRLWATLIAAIAAVIFAGCSLAEEPAPQLLRTVTVAGKDRGLGEPFGILRHDGKTYISDGDGGRILSLDDAGVLTVAAEGLDTPSGIAAGPNGEIFIADTGSHTVKALSADGKLRTVAGVEGSAGSEDGAASQARFRGPIGIAFADDGTIFVADTYNDRIRRISPEGQVTTLAGGMRGYADGTGGLAMFDTPLGIAVWHDKLLVADSGNRALRVVESDGQVWTLVGGPENYGMRDGLLGSATLSNPTAVAVAPNGVIYIADGNAIRAIGRRAFPYLETLTDRRRGLRDGPSLSARFNRPSGIAVTETGELMIADSDNRLLRRLTDDASLPEITADEIKTLHFTADEFRDLAPGRWPYDPPTETREIAGTLGEIRGEIAFPGDKARYHNGLDNPGAYGETARFLRDEKVLDPAAAQNFGTARELLRMPTLGYIHISLGRDGTDKPFGDGRFLFQSDGESLTDVRVPRGTRFRAGEAVGTLNDQNHVHLIAGRPGFEMNALDALVLPGISDSIPPVITDAYLLDANWNPLETNEPDERINISGKIRVVVQAYDRKDGNADRRRLAPYRVGYDIYPDGEQPPPGAGWNISFELMPAEDSVGFVYAPGSRSGARGVTIFNFLASNTVRGEEFSEGFLDADALEPGKYLIRTRAADFFGNIAYKDISVEVN